MYLEGNSEFPLDYLVYSVKDKSLNTETIVLDPNNQKDLDAIRFYAESLSDPMKCTILDWAREYDEFRCLSVRRGDCPLTHSPVCCAHCSYNNSCILLEDTPICSLVALGDVIDIEDCGEI